MKPKPTDDVGGSRAPERELERDVDPREQDPLDRAANRLCIRIHGCCLASLSRRDPEAIERLYRFAEENRARYREWLQRAA